MIQDKPNKVELFLFFIALAMSITGIYYLGPSITGFVVKSSSYAKDLNLVVTSSGNYTLNLENIGDLKSVEIDGRVTNFGKARAYLESNGIKYLIFDSTRLNESKEESFSNESGNLITGFAVKNDQQKKEKNHKPSWTSNINQFTINGTTLINLSQYFIDEDNDSLIYSASEADSITSSINNEIITILSNSGADLNTTITFTASDGIDTKSHTVDLIVIIEKIANVIEPINETNQTTQTLNHAPVWKSEINSFVLSKKLSIDLLQYFTDEDNDSLTFSVSDVSDIYENIDGSNLTLSTDKNNFNATLTIVAFDGNLSSSQEVQLIVPLTPTINETINKAIKINLSYKSGTIYDANDNGEESINGIIDLSVENTGFNWDADQSNLCTRWEIYNVEDGTLTKFCNGNADCCAFLSLLPSKSNWSETYYSVYGKEGAGYDNIISAQVIYYYVNLSLDNPKSEIYLSGLGNLSSKFFAEEKEFFNACLETCFLKGLNKSSYNLLFEIEDDAVLRIDKIKYKLVNDIQNSAPVLLQNFSDISIFNDRIYQINLSNYFYDNDNDRLSYSYYKNDDILVLVEDDIAKIIPKNNFTGTAFMFFVANDSTSFTVSNVFKITVEEARLESVIEFTFDDGEKTNISYYAEIDGEKIKVPHKTSLKEPRKFGFVFDENEIEKEISSKLNAKNFDKKIYYKIESSEQYVPSPNNPYTLERDLIGKTRQVINQIGQYEERQLKRFLSFKDIFGKENNIFETSVEEVNETICSKESDLNGQLNSTQTITGAVIDNSNQENSLQCIKVAKNKVIKKQKNIGFSFIQQGKNWLVEFFNIFDLDPTFLDDTDSNWNTGIFNNMFVDGTGGDANLTGNTTSGFFASQVFDAGAAANWTNITIKTEAHYNIEIGRANGDANQSSLPYVNTSGLVLLMHFNNESVYGENATGGDGDVVLDFSPDVNSERSGSVRNNGTTKNGAIIDKTNYKFGGGAVKFDGSNDYVNIAHDTSLNPSNITFGGWIYPTAVEAPVFVLSKGNSEGTNTYGMYLSNGVGDSSNYIVVTMNGGFGNLRSLPNNQWSHVMVTYSSSVLGIYVNGVITYNPNIGAKTFSVSNALAIGVEEATSFYFKGSMDEISIWNRSLSASEILNIYKRGAYRLNLSARTCDDAACIGENYTNIQPYNITAGYTLPLNLSSTNRFFQYNFTYSNESAYAVKLNVNNLSVQYYITADVNFTNLVNSTSRAMFGFGNGLFNNSLFNSTINAIQLNFNKSQGTYLSQVFDVGSSMQWNNISWTPGAYYGAEIGRASGDSINPPVSTGGFPNISINTSGLVLLLHFNNESVYGENDSLAIDFSVDVNSERAKSSRNNATLVGGAKYNSVTKRFGSSSLNTTGGSLRQYASVADDSSIKFGNNNFTLSVWFNTPVLSGAPLIGKQIQDPPFTGYIIYIRGSGTTLRLDLFDTVGGTVYVLNPSATVADGLWHHVVFTVDRSSTTGVRGYYDSNLSVIGDATLVPGSLATTQKFTIATDATDSTATDFFNGTIDEVAVWNRTLTPGEILNLYKRGAYRLNISVKSCDDAACSGETYFNETHTNSTKSSLNVPFNRFFQYQANFYSNETNKTFYPELYNVTIHYSSTPNFTILVNATGRTHFVVGSGTFSSTYYNTSIGAIQLNFNNTNGTYLSQVFDVGSSMQWNNVSWTPGAYYGVEIGRASGDSINPPVSNGIYPNISINTSGLVLLMHFNNETGENNTLVKDWSVEANSGKNPAQENNGTVMNLSLVLYDYTNVKFGKSSVNFTDGIIQISPKIVMSGAYTFSTWFYRQDSTTNDFFTGNKTPPAINSNPPKIGFLSTNNLFVRTSDEAAALNVDIGYTVSLNGKWNYLAVTRDSSNQIVAYLNTVNTTMGTQAGNAGFEYIGVDDTFNLNYFNGSLDEISIWNRSLSASEILNLYKRGAYRLNISVKSCDDAACSGETFFNETHTNSTKSSLNVPFNRFFQYQANFYSNETNKTFYPELYNVTIHYSSTPNFTILVNATARSHFVVGSGTFSSTYYNTSIGAIQLNFNNTNGTYLSQVFDVGTSQVWNNISWTPGAYYGVEIGRCVAEDSLITLANGTKKKIKDIEAGEYVQSLDENTGKIVSNKVNALIDMGNKTVYQLTTESGRAINTTSNHPYLVKLYSKEECDKYADTVWNRNSSIKDEFIENGFCTRWVEVSDLKEDMEVAVPRIESDYDEFYASERDLVFDFSNSLRSSSVLYNLTFDCFLCNFSLDHKGQLSFNANAKKSTSLRCSGNNNFDSFINSAYADVSMNSTKDESDFISSLNSLDIILDLSNISSLCLFNSSNANFGETSSNSETANFSISCVGDFFQKKEYNMFVSTTNFSGIQIKSCPLSCFNLSSLTFLLKSNTSFSVNSLFSRSISNFSNASSLLIFFINAPLATSDQFIHEKCSMSALSESDNDVIMLAIYNAPLCSFSKALSNSTLFAKALLNISAQFISGCPSNLAFNSSGTDTVIVAIFTPQYNYINTQKSVYIYKSFYNQKEDSDVSFEKITSIKSLDKQQVYDLEIEGTHNFIANDIIAHNTGTDSTNPPVSNGIYPNISINTSGLILLYHFNNESVYGENDSLARDFSPDVNSERATSIRNNGTIYSGAQYNISQKKFGAAGMDFDGINGYINISAASSLNLGSSSISASVWIKTGDTYVNGIEKIIFEHDVWGNTGTYQLTSGTISGAPTPYIAFDFVGANGFESINTSFNDNNWHNIVSVFDDTNNVQSIYYDGRLNMSRTETASVGSSAAPVYIGRRGNTEGLFFNGTIDELSIWNRTLSSAEILNLYKRGAYRLNISVKSCDDAACSGETFFNETHTNSTRSNLNVPFNRFFQYQANFYSNETYKTFYPELYNVTIHYSSTPNFTILVNATGRTHFVVGSGTFSSTYYNTSIGAIQLNFNNTNGTYLSQVFDVGTSQQFNNISWTPGAYYGVEIGRASGDSITPPVSTGGFPNISINTSGLVLLMHFNNESVYGENDSLVRDFSPDVNSERSGSLRNNGTMLNGAHYNSTNKKFGAFSASFLSGQQVQVINISDDNSLDIGTGNLSISLWFSTDYIGSAALINKQIIPAPYTGYALYIRGTGTNFRFDLADTVDVSTFTMTPTTNFTDGSWHNVAFTLDRGSTTGLKGYFDGVLLTTQDPTARQNSIANDQKFMIATDSIGYFNGSIDELSFWNRSLSSGEILNLYKRGALRLNISVKSCANSDCSDKTSFEINATNSTKTNINALPNNRYFQYQANFFNNETNTTFYPELYNVTINYGATVNSCTCPGSGDWLINCADNCIITSDCNMQGNKVTGYGTGSVTFVNAKIYNYNQLAVHGGCTFVCRSANGCFG